MHLYLEFGDYAQAADIRDMIFKDKMVKNILDIKKRAYYYYWMLLIFCDNIQFCTKIKEVQTSLTLNF